MQFAYFIFQNSFAFGPKRIKVSASVFAELKNFRPKQNGIRQLFLSFTFSWATFAKETGSVDCQFNFASCLEYLNKRKKGIKITQRMNKKFELFH